MVKRFKKGQPYTLCLIYQVSKRNETTLVRNVTFKNRIEDIYEFESDNYIYVVDMGFNVVFCDSKEGNEKQLQFHLTNIVSGWQY